jgi:hypothetical protein
VPIRLARTIAVTVLVGAFGVLGLAAAPESASATPACWRQVINEWVATDHVSSNYPLHCYREAIAHVPEDLRVYSSIVDDITAALQGGVRTTQAHNGPPTTAASRTPSASVFSAQRTWNSLPLPVLILAGLSVALMAAGAAGLISRRLKTRRVPAP